MNREIINTVVWWPKNMQISHTGKRQTGNER